jgi:hypothetical protein
MALLAPRASAAIAASALAVTAFEDAQTRFAVVAP